MNPTIKGFAAFVKEQDADRAIDHTSCNTCAIGDYVQENSGLSKEKLLEKVRKGDHDYAWELFREIELSRGFPTTRYKTYGDLQKALEEAEL